MDLTLPAQCPEVKRYRTKSSGILPIALYTLIEMSSEDLEAIRKRCVSMLENHYDVILIPQEHRFIGGPLRAVLDQHITLGLELEFDPVWFLVVTTESWDSDGILMVGLDTDTGDALKDEWPDPVVSSGYFKAEGTGLDLVNLQISKIEWEDVIENPIVPLHPSVEDLDEEPSNS